MPFSHGGHGISCVLEALGPGLDRGVQRVDARHVDQLTILGFSPRSGPHVENLVPRRVLTREETRACRRAVGGTRIGVRKDHALGGQLIEVGSLEEVRTHIARIFPPKIVEKDEQDVRLIRGRLGHGTAQPSHQKQQHKHAEQDTHLGLS